jgi:lysophospholipase L1-like esterase
MARDGFHPGPAIYSAWADDAAQAMARHLGKTAARKR